MGYMSIPDIMRNRGHMPLVTYQDDYNVWAFMAQEFRSRLPLRNVTWGGSPKGEKKQIIDELELDVRPFHPSLVSRKNTPTSLQYSFLSFYIVHCDDIDTYKQIVKPRILQWLTNFKENQKQEWLIVYVDLGGSNSKGKISKFKLGGNVYDRLRSEFGGGGKNDRIVRLGINGGDHDKTGSESWSEFLLKVGDSVMANFERHVAKYRDSTRAMLSNRLLPGWNYCSFFVLKENLAFAFDAMNLPREALVQYDELDALFAQLEDKQTKEGGRIPFMDWFGGAGMYDGSESFLDVTKKPYSDMIHQSTITIFDLRNYLIARQCQLLFLMDKPLIVAKRVHAFIIYFTSKLKRTRGFPSSFVDNWVFTACTEVVETCTGAVASLKPPLDDTDMRKFNETKADLCTSALYRLSSLGVQWGMLPSRPPFMFSRVSTETKSNIQISDTNTEKVSEDENLSYGRLRRNSKCSSSHPSLTSLVITDHGSDRPCSDAPTVADISNSFVGLTSEDALGVSTVMARSGSEPSMNWLEHRNITNPRLFDASQNVLHFDRLYEELCNTTLETLNIVGGRDRFSPMIKRHLAGLFIARGSFKRALPFLEEIYTLLSSKDWTSPDDIVLQDLATCYRHFANKNELLKTLLSLSLLMPRKDHEVTVVAPELRYRPSSPCLALSVMWSQRNHEHSLACFQGALQLARHNDEESSQVDLSLMPHIFCSEVLLMENEATPQCLDLIVGNYVTIRFLLSSCFPDVVEDVSVAVRFLGVRTEKSTRTRRSLRSHSGGSMTPLRGSIRSVTSIDDVMETNFNETTLTVPNFSSEVGHSTSPASSPDYLELNGLINNGDNNNSLVPGDNIVSATLLLNKCGVFEADTVVVSVGRLRFTHVISKTNARTQKLVVHASKPGVTTTVLPHPHAYLTGVQQLLRVRIDSGEDGVASGAVVIVSVPAGLAICGQPSNSILISDEVHNEVLHLSLDSDGRISLPIGMKPGEAVETDLPVLTLDKDSVKHDIHLIVNYEKHTGESFTVTSSSPTWFWRPLSLQYDMTWEPGGQGILQALVTSHCPSPLTVISHRLSINPCSNNQSICTDDAANSVSVTPLAANAAVTDCILMINGEALSLAWRIAGCRSNMGTVDLTFAVTFLFNDSNEKNVTKVIPLALPLHQVEYTVEIRPVSERAVVGEAFLVNVIVLACGVRPRNEDHQVLFHVNNNSEHWLVAGKKCARVSSTTEAVFGQVPIRLVPLCPGSIPLPCVTLLTVQETRDDTMKMCQPVRIPLERIVLLSRARQVTVQPAVCMPTLVVS